MASAALELLITLRDEATGPLGAITGAVGNLGAIVTGAAVGGFVALGAAIVSGIGDAREAASIMAQTENVIASTGGAAGVSAEHIADYAASLSAASGASLFGDSQIQESENLLLTFTNIKGATLDAATAISVDLAQAMGGAPADSAIQLGKALNDPIAGISALSRVGVSFSEEQKEMIRTMQEHGDMAGAQGIILAELNKEFGGSAAAAAAADGGWAQLNDRMGEAKETLGAAFLPLLGQLSGFLNASIIPAVETAAAAFAAWLSNPATQAGIQQIVSAIQGGLVAAFAALSAVWTSTLQPMFATLVGWLQGALPQAIAFVTQNWDLFKGALIAVGAVLAGAAIAGTILSLVALIASLANPITLAIGAVALLGAAWAGNWGGIQEKTAAAWSFLQPIFAQLISWLQQALPVAITFLSNLWTSTLQPALQAVGAFIIGTVIPALGLLVTWLQQNIPVAIAAASQVWTGTLQPALQAVGTFITGTAIPAISNIATWLQQNIPAAIAAASTAFQSIAGTVSSVASSIQSGINTVVTVVQAAWNTVAFVTSSVWGALAGLISPVIGQIVSVISPALAQIQAGWQVAWGAVQSVTASVISTVQGVIQGAINFIQSVWGGGIAAVQTQTAGVWGQIQGVIQSAIGVIQSVIQAGVAVVQSIMSTAWQVVVAAAENDFGRIPGIISAGWESIKGIFNAGIEAVKGAFGQFVSDAVGLGADIVGGIASGISGAVGGLVNAAVDAATSALDAAKSALGISSPSQVMAEEVGGPIILGIVQGILAAAPKVSKAMVGVMQGVFDVISSGLGAFKALREFQAIPMRALLDFEDALEQILSTFIALSSSYNKKILGAAIAFADQTTSVMGTITSAVDAFALLREFEAPARQYIDAFGAVLSHVVALFLGIAFSFATRSVAFAADFAEATGKIVGMIGTALTAFSGLVEFEAPTWAAIDSFTRTLDQVVSSIIAMTEHFEQEGLTFAGIFGEAAGKIVGMIGTAVTSFAALNDVAPVASRTIQVFGETISAVVASMIEVAARFDAEGLGAAGVFADTAGKIVGLIGQGVDAFLKLVDFGGVPIAAVRYFATAVMQTVDIMIQIAGRFAVDAVEQAAAFSAAAQTIVQIIGSGVEGFEKLRDFAGVPYSSIVYFATALLQFVDVMTNIMTRFAADALEQARVFSEAAHSVVGVLSDGVAGFTAIREFAPVPYLSMVLFATALLQFIDTMTNVMTRFAADALEQAAHFAEAGGKIIAILGGGVEGFLKLADFQGVPTAAIDAFGQALNATVITIANIAVQWSTEALEAATRFADTAGSVVGLLGSGVDGLIKLKDFTEVPASAIALFGEAVRQMVVQIAGLAGQWSTEALEAARVFSESASAVVSLMGEALDAFTKLADFKAVGGDLIKAFADGLTGLLAQFQGIALPAATDIGTQIIEGMVAAVTASTPNLVNAILASIQAALQAARQALGIASPSKVFADLVGLPMAQGMAVGLGRGAPMVAGAVRGLSGAAVGASTTNQYNYNITYSENIPSTGSAAQDIRLLSILTQ